MSDAATFQIPRITTERLLLREARRSDFAAFAADNANAAARAHLGVMDRRMAWRVINSGTGMWAIDGAGWWMVELRATGEPVGSVGAFFREALGSEPKPDLELGWAIYRPHWRRGFATEAARAALRFGIDVHHVKRVIAHIDASNVASVRVSERLGMRFDAEVDFYGERTNRYALHTSSAR